MEKVFRSRVKKIANNDSESPLLPDYKIRYLSDKDQVIFFNRKGKKAAKAEFDAAIKTMFQPTETKKRKHRHSSKAQIELEL